MSMYWWMHVCVSILCLREKEAAASEQERCIDALVYFIWVCVSATTPHCFSAWLFLFLILPVCLLFTHYAIPVSIISFFIPVLLFCAREKRLLTPINLLHK